MPWTVKLSTKASNYYERLDKDLRTRIKEALKDMADLDDPLAHPKAGPLTGELKGFSRLHIGGFRVVFTLITVEKIIAVVNIRPRGDVYKK
jgi:mRNA-degrading endonuclease RelE of RelBE toxin-antitoxin system